MLIVAHQGKLYNAVLKVITQIYSALHTRHPNSLGGIMVTIHKSYPFKNFARWIWEFKADRVLVSMHSLTADNHWEVPYRNIQRIHHRKDVDFSTINVASSIVALLVFGLLANAVWHFANPIVWSVAKVLAIVALLLWIPGFKKHEYYLFLGTNSEPLVTLKANSRNHGSIEEAIRLVKSKSKISEDNYDEPMPKKKPLFELVDFDPLFYFTRRQILFYPNRILRYSRSLISDSFITSQYSQLNGKVSIARLGDNSWEYIWCYWLYLVSTIGLVMVLFFPHILYQNRYSGWIFGIAYGLLIPLFLLKFWKREIWILLDNRGEQAIFIPITSANRENLQRIGAFIAKKVGEKKRKPA